MGSVRRLRIAVPGLERNPRLAGAVVARLRARPEVVRATASPLTGRVLVELSSTTLGLQELLTSLSDIDLPDLPPDDAPAHPLDLEPLLQSGARLAGAIAGMAVVAIIGARRDGLSPAGREVSPSGRAGAWAAAAVGTVESFPPLRSLTRRLGGRSGSEALFTTAGVVALTFAGNPLGLAVTAAGALRSFSELRARRAAWVRYEEAVGGGIAEPGSLLRLRSGERPPLDALVREGSGTTVTADGLMTPVRPGDSIDAGSILHGGPWLVELRRPRACSPITRPHPPRPRLDERYVEALGPIALGYAALTAVVTRSWRRALISFVMVNPRAALIGTAAAGRGAFARSLRAGGTIVGGRREHGLRQPDTLVLDGVRLLTDGYEVQTLRARDPEAEVAGLLAIAAAVSSAAGDPWGAVFARTNVAGREGSFDGSTAQAIVDGRRWRLHQERSERAVAPLTLVLSDAGGHMVASIPLRPRVAGAARELIRGAARHGIGVVVAHHGSAVVLRSVTARLGIDLIEVEGPAELRRRQQLGERVAVLSDTPDACEIFAAADFAIAVGADRHGHFAAAVDIVVPDLVTAAAVLDAACRREVVARDATILSAAANLVGAIWSLRQDLGINRAASAVHVATLAALADGAARLWGGERPRSIAQLLDPQPERWGEPPLAEVLSALRARPEGLTRAEAAKRLSRSEQHADEHPLRAAIEEQLVSPLTAILAGASVASLALGAVGDVAVIATVILVNVAVGAWQEHQAERAAAALEQLSSPRARVLRSGEVVVVPANELVVGDTLLLGAGDRVAADARLLQASSLEVDESSMTGESLPVAKLADAPDAADRIVLAGSDVTVGSGSAVAVAVGPQTRLGTIATALELAGRPESRLSQRLEHMLRDVLPYVVGGGGLVLAAGVLWRRPLLPQAAIAASVALAALPEGLPLLAGVAESAAARRLATRGGLVRRLAAIEALGRVDVACVDKTGTLTEGRLEVSVVVDAAGAEGAPDAGLSPTLRAVLGAAALASPHPSAPDALAHPTDRAVIDAARRAGLRPEDAARRTGESPFDPAQSFHATAAGERVAVKGAPEEILARCELDGEQLAAWLARADALAERGLRVLMVAGGSATAGAEDPRGLSPLGFIGISDPLRPDVADAVARCQAAGVRVVMLTGDHPLTARAVAAQAGILDGGDILTGDDLSGLDIERLEQRLEHAVTVARVSPLDKVRIVEVLQRLGHTVAMTGDGVNDAPALRLADIGVAMGRHGTDVARGAADIVLADDRFPTLVEALVEGRSFWRNIRRSLALLLGGNLGEVGLVVGASLLGRAAPLRPRQILVVNLVTDVLPALAVAVRRPRTHHLDELAREGLAGLGRPLREEALRRGLATALPALTAYLLAEGMLGAQQAGGVAFAAIVLTQLGQALELGRAEGTLATPVAAAVGASAALLAACFALPPARAFLGLVVPGPAALALMLASAAVAIPLAQVGAPPLQRSERRAL